jgi:hypothetical protein
MRHQPRPAARSQAIRPGSPSHPEAGSPMRGVLSPGNLRAILEPARPSAANPHSRRHWFPQPSATCRRAIGRGSGSRQLAVAGAGGDIGTSGTAGLHGAGPPADYVTIASYGPILAYFPGVHRQLSGSAGCGPRPARQSRCHGQHPSAARRRSARQLADPGAWSHGRAGQRGGSSRAAVPDPAIRTALGSAIRTAIRTALGSAIRTALGSAGRAGRAGLGPATGGRRGVWPAGTA